jgi:hypothetical protein
MFDSQIDALEPTPAFIQERRTVVAATFDKLGGIHAKQW